MSNTFKDEPYWVHNKRSKTEEHNHYRKGVWKTRPILNDDGSYVTFKHEGVVLKESFIRIFNRRDSVLFTRTIDGEFFAYVTDGTDLLQRLVKQNFLHGYDMELTTKTIYAVKKVWVETHDGFCDIDKAPKGKGSWGEQCYSYAPSWAKRSDSDAHHYDWDKSRAKKRFLLSKFVKSANYGGWDTENDDDFDDDFRVTAHFWYW